MVLKDKGQGGVEALLCLPGGGGLLAWGGAFFRLNEYCTRRWSSRSNRYFSLKYSQSRSDLRWNLTQDWSTCFAQFGTGQGLTTLGRDSFDHTSNRRALHCDLLRRLAYLHFDCFADPRLDPLGLYSLGNCATNASARHVAPNSLSFGRLGRWCSLLCRWLSESRSCNR